MIKHDQFMIKVPNNDHEFKFSRLWN